MRSDQSGPQNDYHARFRELGEKSLSTDIVERDRAAAFAHGDWLRCAEEGLQALILPAEYGGAGADIADYVRAMEGLGYGCHDNGLLLSLGAHILAVEVPIWKFGTEAQRRRYLPELGSGRMIGANAMTEPGTGSDAMALACAAERDGDGYRLTGRKCYVTNAPVAGVFIVYATIDRTLGFTGVTAFLVEAGDPGVTVTPGPEKMGLRTAPWGEITLDGCWVPAARRLGADKQGSSIFGRTMTWERSFLLAPWLGVMHREIDHCIRYSRRRRQFGHHLGHFQSVSNRLVDMWMRQEAARLFTYRAAAEMESGRSAPLAEASKLSTSDAAIHVFTEAVQIYGARGFTTRGPAERHLRDAHGMSITSGTADLQRVVIAHRLGITRPAWSADEGEA